MTQKEILEIEESNTDSIYLYLEGSFYKAYERSAFAFHTRVREFRILRKESKSLGRDILYLGFPMTALERNTSNLIVKKINNTSLRAILSLPLDENDYVRWRDAQEVALSNQSLRTQFTRVAEKTPVYKNAYDILTQIILIAKNISRSNQIPFGRRIKELSYLTALNVRILFELEAALKIDMIDKTEEMYDELSFLLQILCDAKEISVNSFALLSEKIKSVKKQLYFLQQKATSSLPAEIN